MGILPHPLQPRPLFDSRFQRQSQGQRVCKGSRNSSVMGRLGTVGDRQAEGVVRRGRWDSGAQYLARVVVAQLESFILWCGL
jgi:hypothetical protein